MPGIREGADAGAAQGAELRAVPAGSRRGSGLPSRPVSINPILIELQSSEPSHPLLSGWQRACSMLILTNQAPISASEKLTMVSPRRWLKAAAVAKGKDRLNFLTLHVIEVRRNMRSP